MGGREEGVGWEVGVRGREVREEGEGCERVRGEGEGSGVIEEIGRNRERREVGKVCKQVWREKDTFFSMTLRNYMYIHI